MRFAVHTALWVDRWGEDLTPHLQQAAALGFDGAEVSLLGLDEAGADRVAQVAADLGIAIRCTTGLGPDNDPSSVDEAVRAAALDALRAGVELTQRCGASVLTGVTHSGWGVARTKGHAGALDRAASTLSALVPTLDDGDVTLGLEAVNRFESDVINTADDAVALTDAIGSPRVGVHLDTFHMNIEEPSFLDACRTAGDRLMHVHVADHDRGAPTGTRLPWAELATGLAAVGYDDWIGLELFVRGGVDVSGDLRIWRDIEPDATAAASSGLAFVRELLA